MHFNKCKVGLLSLLLSFFVLAHFSVSSAFARSINVKVCQKKSMSGNSSVFKTLLAATQNARKVWRSKVRRKYGRRWASWKLARKGFKNCESMPNFKKNFSVGGFYCTASARPCRWVKRQ